ncbi:MAG: choice-of-anchor D domain-containing protein, partial [Myxococcales bacterium]|nr:choice-of-anchor D domain-containing protein [Myxococcales bacterium]
RSGDANAEAQVLDLRGLAANITLTVEPDHLSFGNVVANTTKTLSLTVSNDTDVDVWIQLADGDNVTRCSAGAGDSAFCVILTDGGLGPDGRFSLGARASTTIDVRFSPLIAGLHDRGQFTLRACASSACEVQVQLEGLAVASGLRCEPATLDFGQVTPGACLTRSATCENVANVPVTVMGWGPSLGASAGTSLDFAFEASSVTVVDEGDALEIYVTYCPDDVGDDAGNLQVETDQDQPSRYVFVGLRGAGG